MVFSLCFYFVCSFVEVLGVECLDSFILELLLKSE